MGPEAEDILKTFNLPDDEAKDYAVAVGLGLIQFVGEVNIKADIFGFGEWDTEEVTLRINEGATPYSVQAARAVAISLKEALKRNLQALENQDVRERKLTPLVG